jgi:hypothetical protein
MAQVTVAIPTYNRAALLKEALDSVCRQTFVDFEILVCDNCSTDDSPAMVRAYPDARVRYHRNEQNLGQFGNISKTIELTESRYWALLMDDDLWHPDFLRVAMEGMAAHPRAGLSTWAVMEGPSPESVQLNGTRRVWTFTAGVRQTHSFLTPAQSATLLFLSFPLHPSGFLAITEIARRYVPLYGRANWAGDHYLAAQLGLAGGIVWSPLELVFARAHGSRETAVTGLSAERGQAEIEIQERIRTEALAQGIDVVSEAAALVSRLSLDDVKWLMGYLGERPRSAAREAIYLLAVERIWDLPSGEGRTFLDRQDKATRRWMALKRPFGPMLSFMFRRLAQRRV